ncbi:tripartite tricarboxylate transporter substrate binding protein [Acidovorax sp. Be4]|uniref:Tripartite tricarboxylate transporter substrate binding protein n=1 Tax=Acidovorax bellezanensis TaxID=2976702 RepID=A0ABT2PL23_9BURK|nr:tripartite tricarboxylate transporter substrate binding protein [Acidovorax sp. Be4]MCT9811176.1 tripartite tricarboxylate transporter substrate binding protein [Acidovorax sp. Be4]
MKYLAFKFSWSGPIAAIGIAIGVHSPGAVAQTAYPAKPIRVVVGYAPGGAVDTAGRIAGDMLAKYLHATVVIDNVPGAAGVVGAQRVVGAAADGYTLLLGSSNELAATKLVNPAQKYDPLKDLTPIGLVATSPLVWVAGPHIKVKATDEFIALIKANPGKYSYGSSGVGSTLHFAGEMLKQRANLKMPHIPYRGTAPLLSDLAGGTLDFAMVSPTAAAPFIQSGRITALGVTSATRFTALPLVPALAENAALKDFELNGWFALMAPRNLPADIQQKLSAALQQGLQDAPLRKRLAAAGTVPAGGSEDLRQTMQVEQKKYAELVRFADFKD